MPISTILDVAIGVSLILLALSAVCSSVNELIARFVNLRAKFLEQGIINLLSDQNDELSADIIRHPLIRRMGTDARQFPAYIPSATFALALMDALRARAGGPAAFVTQLQLEIQKLADDAVRKPLLEALSHPDARVALEQLRLAVAAIQDAEVRASVAGLLNGLEVTEIKQGILAVPDPRIQQVLFALLNETETQIQRIEDVKSRLEIWFNDGMDRVTVLYKNFVEWILRVLAILVCFSFNADALHIVNTLWQDPTIREALVVQAQATVQNPPPAATPGQGQGTISEAVKNLTDSLNQLVTLPLGWNCNEYNNIVRAGWTISAPSGGPAQPGAFCEEVPGGVVTGGSFSFPNLLTKLIGLLLMSAAVSFGAPFWFNVLTRIVPLRADKPKS